MKGVTKTENEKKEQKCGMKKKYTRLVLTPDKMYVILKGQNSVVVSDSEKDGPWKLQS